MFWKFAAWPNFLRFQFNSLLLFFRKDVFLLWTSYCTLISWKYFFFSITVFLIISIFSISILHSVIFLCNECFFYREPLITLQLHQKISSFDNHCFSNYFNLFSISILLSLISRRNECFIYCEPLIALRLSWKYFFYLDHCFSNDFIFVRSQFHSL